MKKLLIFILLFTLVGCQKEDKEPEQVQYIEFAGATYEFLKEEAGYDQFTNGGHIVEVQYGTTTIVTTEIDGDIYIITGSKLTYTISKNGTTILICEGAGSCTGFESVDFQDDIIGIIEQYEEE